MTQTAKSTFGFSLLELMVVVSIISMISVLSLPYLFRMKIKAAQAEMYGMIKGISGNIKSYCIDNNCNVAGSTIVGQYGSTFAGGVEDDYCSSPNSIGFSSSSCDQLRYYYSYSIVNENNYSVSAQSVYYQMAGTLMLRQGNKYGPPTRMCKNPFGLDIYYCDLWNFSADTGVLAPAQTAGCGIPGTNALETCFPF